MGESLELHVTTAPLRQLSDDLQANGKTLDKSIQKAIVDSAEQVANDYRSTIRGYSTSVPPTIKVVATRTGAEVVATAPLAKPMENAGKSGSFRHPVWGHTDRWVGQEAHPAAADALQRNADAIVNAVDQAIAKWATSVGFK